MISTVFSVQRFYGYITTIESLYPFCFLYLFSDDNFREFVGSTNPDLFQSTIVFYLGANILIGLALPIFVSDEFVSKAAPSFVILTADIIALTLLMSASGGVASGLGNFLDFHSRFWRRPDLRPYIYRITCYRVHPDNLYRILFVFFWMQIKYKVFSRPAFLGLYILSQTFFSRPFRNSYGDGKMKYLRWKRSIS